MRSKSRKQAKERHRQVYAALDFGDAVEMLLAEHDTDAIAAFLASRDDPAWKPVAGDVETMVRAFKWLSRSVIKHLQNLATAEFRKVLALR